jgi:1,2-diacylglycerol 3-alpha-glucosyltransferase
MSNSWQNYNIAAAPAENMATVALIFTNYGPYHLARLDGLHKVCDQMGWHAIGIELARSEATYPWKANIDQLPFDFVSIVKGEQLESISFHRLVKGLFSALSEAKPDVVAIAGYAHPAIVASLIWCVWHRKPAILLSASKEDDTSRRWWIELLKSRLLKFYRTALVGGKPQARYLTKLGMSADKIFYGYNVVGNEAFHPQKIRAVPRPLNQPFFLSVNRFVPKKNLLNLLTAYASYHQQTGVEAWHLVLCGDGELRPQIEQQIQKYGLSNYVHLPGFLQQAELIPYYAHAGCLIHSSIQEQWGLVVNEAMAAGLPVIVSNRCGCHEDLVLEGINGFSFDPENVEALTHLMMKIGSNAIDLNAMGQASLQHIQNFSPEYFAENLIKAAKQSLVQSGQRQLS